MLKENWWGSLSNKKKKNKTAKNVKFGLMIDVAQFEWGLKYYYRDWMKRKACARGI